MSTFEYKKRLGSGYFGEVWLVNDTGLNALYALKLIPPDKVINPSNFYQEAQTLKAAEHPNIVQVTETGTLDDNRIYVKMEYLKNGSLEDKSSGAYVDLTKVKRFMVDMLRGLAHAHSKKIIHRDIKPANILIGNSSEGKLSDFGLALPDLTKIDTSTLKKYQYWMHLAPEVDNLADYDYLSDIYSCGMTLYRLVNGDSFIPIFGGNELRKMIKLGKFPDRNKYREFVPNSLKRVINKALSINPDDRFKSADSMRRALEQVPLNVDWKEKLLINGICWEGEYKEYIIIVSRIKNKDGLWDVEFRKGKKLSQLRMLNNIGIRDVKVAKANQRTRKILQAFVTGDERNL